MRHIHSFFCAALVCGLMAACSAQNPSPTSTPNVASHAMPTANANLPYDAAFMDAMIAHHQGAIDMTYQARQGAERTEIKDFLEQIALEQAGEIKQMRAWRAEWYPNLAASAIAPNDMVISGDAATPFDIRFINAMIPHHEAAIKMANEAKTKTTRPELLKLADAIIKTQTSEIGQMQKWKSEWAK
ncbi:MAG TPA: DUF305 domain-containing protein [Thermoflexales bacterium]|nr:DUF305 domain-containing protein [Thermoflexales bacterium]